MLTLLLASVFLNGVNIDGLRSQKFEKCKTVRIDDRGDVHLDCPGYQVERPSGAVPASTATSTAGPAIAPLLQSAVTAALTKRYWLVSEEKEGAEFDVDVFVNAKFIRKIRAGEPQVVLEITRYLHPGTNKVLFAAAKRADRKSASPGSFLKLVVGEGDAGGNTVTIDNPLIETKRTAAETENVNEEFTLQGR